MAQNRESGRKAREFGLTAARKLIRAVGGEQRRANSNEFKCGKSGKRGVMKVAGPDTTIIGVTRKMRPRLDFVVAAFQRPGAKGEKRVFDLYAFCKPDFRRVFYKSSVRKNGGRLWFARKAVVIERGKRCGKREICVPE